jgi:hypothetical protein
VSWSEQRVIAAISVEQVAWVDCMMGGVSGIGVALSQGRTGTEGGREVGMVSQLPSVD